MHVSEPEFTIGYLYIYYVRTMIMQLVFFHRNAMNFETALSPPTSRTPKATVPYIGLYMNNINFNYQAQSVIWDQKGLGKDTGSYNCTKI